MRLTLREWRRVKEMSQEEMANVCGVHLNTYRAWEENPAEIRLSKANLIADALGISITDIILPEDITKPCMNHETEDGT